MLIRDAPDGLRSWLRDRLGRHAGTLASACPQAWEEDSLAGNERAAREARRTRRCGIDRLGSSRIRRQSTLEKQGQRDPPRSHARPAGPEP